MGLGGGAARSASDLRTVLDRCREGFVVRQVPVREAVDWAVVGGALQHASGGFFSVNGLSTGAEDFVLLYQPQAAVTGVVSAVVEGERWFLLQGRAEPGCLGEAQFGPTVQSTPANYMRLHGGEATPYVNAFIRFDPDVSVIDDTTQLDLGERYLFKSKRSIHIETRSPASSPPAFAWANPEAICEGVSQSAFFNIDLRSILAIADWSGDGGSGLSPRSARVRKSLTAPVRADVMGDLLSKLGSRNRTRSRFVPLASLANWRQSEWGWSEREAVQGFKIDFFEAAAPFREVARWVQPLVNSSSQGHVILACRERRGMLEFLVQAVAERGLATGSSLAPSYLRYPGQKGEPPRWLTSSGARTLSSTLESDEGGRFYRDASAYEVVEVGEGDQEGPGVWLRLSELKRLLRMSNVCTIQLRGVASQLLAAP